ncbi:MAG TPA: AMP-dependent synthetase/ligase [Burkholderiales bacterium]|nr:AMP-dependent synthetase/ligase [Burkholderiales bacterium]
MPTLRTLPDLFRERIAATPRGEAYRQYDRAAGRWQSVDWSEIGRRAGRWMRALRAEARLPGSRVAILARGSIEHVCLDQAALALGMVPVPLHAIDNPESIAYILADSGAQLLMVETEARWSALAGLRQRFPDLKKVLCLEKPEGSDATWAENWLKAGDGAPDAAPAAIQPEALAAIVYTSGTTGKPKGVMLTHRNVVSNVEALLEIVDVRADDVFLSFLPLSHTFERTVGYYTPIAAGSCVAYARSVQELPQDLREARPTILVSVPRVYERIHAKLQENLFARLAWPMLDALLVGPRVRAQFGGRLRFAITGGAPMALAIAERFRALGVEVLQGYGMTESSPVVSANRPGANDPDSVGPPIPGVEVKIGANEELLVKGPNVMAGYLNRPADTAKAVEDGWLHTGDQAFLRDGRIHIKGRIKDIIVTSTGEKIAPGDLELALQSDPLFTQALVIGENRPFLAALLVLDRAHWTREAAALGVNPADMQSLDAAPVKKFALERIRKALGSFPSYATPRAAWMTLEPWTIDNGLMTPTLKLKRPAIEERFAEQIRRLYDNRSR